MKKSELRQLIREELKKENAHMHSGDRITERQQPSPDAIKKIYKWFAGLSSSFIKKMEKEPADKLAKVFKKLGDANKINPGYVSDIYDMVLNKQTMNHVVDAILEDCSTKKKELTEADVIEKGIKNFFAKLRSRKNKKVVDQALEDDPELKKALDYVASKGDELVDLLNSF